MRYVLMLVLLTVAARAAEPTTADDWFALAIEIQRDIEQADFEHRKIDRLDAEDRRFVHKMINELSLSQDAKPTTAQASWLLAIRDWIEAGKH